MLFGVVALTLLAASVFAQDTAYVPFKVNVNATVKAQQGTKTDSINVTVNTIDTLHFVSEIPYALASPGRTQKPVDVEIFLYSLNGKRVLHDKVSASKAMKNISYPNIAMGVYVLYIKENSNAFSTRLAHQGGEMNIDVSFGGIYPLKKEGSTAFGTWDITVSAEGYSDSTYTLKPVKGINELQNITLNPLSSSSVETPSSSSFVETPPSSSSVETLPSSSSAETTLSSSSVETLPSSSSAETLPSSSSAETTLSSSSVETLPSSSSAETLPSSSSAETIPSSSSADTIPSSSSADNGDSSSSADKIAARNLTFDDIQYWVGQGPDSAMFVVQWNDDLSPDGLVWGYLFDSKDNNQNRGVNMVYAVLKEDPRFFALFFNDNRNDPNGNLLGVAVGGLGYDINGNGVFKLILNNATQLPDNNGLFTTDSYNFDDYAKYEPEDHWQSGWYENGYWSYWVTDAVNGKWEYSNWGASSRVLQNKSIDAWYFDIDAFTDYEKSTFYRCMSDPDECDGARDYFGNITPISKPR